MSELNTKSLSELATVDSLGNTDKVLIESGGLMKKANPSIIGGGGGMIVNITADESTGYATMDKTFAEIKDAVDAGKLVMFKQDDVTSVLVSIETGSDRHIYYYNERNMFDFVASSDTDYPKMELGG